MVPCISSVMHVAGMHIPATTSETYTFVNAAPDVQRQTNHNASAAHKSSDATEVDGARDGRTDATHDRGRALFQSRQEALQGKADASQDRHDTTVYERRETPHVQFLHKNDENLKLSRSGVGAGEAEQEEERQRERERQLKEQQDRARELADKLRMRKKEMQVCVCVFVCVCFCITC
jgi:hypothetical protein